MFGHKTFRKFTAAIILALMTLQSFPAWSAVADAVQQPEPLLVKLVPSAVNVDTAGLDPLSAEAEAQGASRLFDGNTATSYMPDSTRNVAVTLPASEISRIRVYGSSSYLLNVYRGQAGSWENVPSLCGLDLESLTADTWHTFTVDSPVTAGQLRLELIPKGNITAGLPELEIWGTASVSAEVASLSLDGIVTPKQALDILAQKPGHIFTINALPSLFAVPVGVDQSVAVATLSVVQSPSSFKRAYLLYDGYNIARSVSIQKSINDGPWTGGV